MHLLLSVTVVVATAFGTEWLVGSWLGEARRFWVGIGGVTLLVLAGALVQASGVAELTRILRNAVVGTGIGAVLRCLGLRQGVAGAESPPDAARPWSRASGWLLTLGWAGTLVGMGMIWTGVFAG